MILAAALDQGAGDPADTGFCFVLVNPAGRLSIVDAPFGGPALFPLGRRTVSGLVWRIDLGDRLVCWLDGDAYGGAGSVNLAATQMSRDLLGDHQWPFDEPYLCGPALFTGRDAAGRSEGLCDGQLSLLVEAHAAAEEWADLALIAPDGLTGEDDQS
jgi:hypothetical protein